MLDLTRLFSYSRDLGFITDLQGSILAGTSGSERALGYVQAEMVGRDLSHLDDSGELRRFFEAEQPRSRMNLTFQLRTRPGSVLTVNALASSLRDADGSPVGWFIAGQDLKDTLTEARGSRPILDALMDSIGAALWSFDRDGTVITWGRACESAFGYTREQAEGRLAVSRLFPAPAEYRRVVDAVDQSGQFSGELPLIGRAGSARLHHASVTPLITGGLPVGYSCVSFDIGDRKRAEEFQRVLFQQAGEAILVVDAESLRILDANAKAWEIHGYTREEFLNLHTAEVADPSGRPEVSEVVRILRESGHYEGDRHFHRRKDGSKFPCAINLRQVSVGGRGYLISVVRDLTEQRRAEEFLRVLFEKAIDPVYVVEDETLRVVEANQAACRLLGYPREEFVRLEIVDLVPPAYRDRIPEFHASVRKDPGFRRDRRMLLRKDGSVVATDHAVFLVEISGKPYYIASCRDLTEQDRAARELEEAKAFLEHVQDNASDGLALLDENGVYVAVNRKLLEMSARRREELIGTAWMARATTDRREAFRRTWERLMQGERISMRTTIERPGLLPIIVDVSAACIVRGERKFAFAIIRDVTDQVKVEEELRRSREGLERHVEERTAQLRESEEKFRGAFARGGIGMALTGIDGRFLQVNQSLCDMLGYSGSDLLKATFQEITHPDDRELSAGALRRLLEGPTDSERMEKRYHHRDGRVVWVDLSTTLVRDGGGTPLYFVTTLQDVTERKRAEEELRRSEERFRSITEATPSPITITRPDGEILFVNEAAARLFGLGPEKTAGRNAADFYGDPSDRAPLRDRILRDGEVTGHELRLRRADGTLFWTMVNFTQMTFQGGPAILSSFVDIDDRKRAEDALRESEGRFRAITEGVPVSVVIARASDGAIQYANEAAARSLGLDQKSVVGRIVSDFLVRPKDREEIRSRLEREGFVRDLEIQFHRADGTPFWGISSLRLAMFKGEPATLGVFSDITPRKQAEELLRKTHEELERRVAERTAELARANALLQEEIAERKRAENALRLILEGTAALTGGSFFRSLARHLASALNVKYASVNQKVSDPSGRTRTIAFWDGSGFADSLEYPLSGMPCDDVSAGEACSYSHDVQRLFPEARMLTELGVESYMGVPLLDSGGTLVGHLFVMDVRPIADEERKLSVLKIFAARAGVELERQLAENALRESEERWRSLVANAPDFIITSDREGKIQSINRLIMGLRMEDVIGRPVFEFIPEGSKETVLMALEKVFKEGKSQAYETRAIGPSGTLAWYNTRVGPIVIRGEVVGATFIATDISERRMSEERQKVQHESTRILTEAGSLEEAVPRILQRVCDSLDWHLGMLWKIDPVANVLRLSYAWHAPGSPVGAFAEASRTASFRPGVGIPGRVWSDLHPTWIPDVRKDSNFPRQDAAREAGLHAAFAVPVEGPQGLLGVLEFLSVRVQEPDEALLRTATALGSQIGQFHERKRAEADLRFQKSLLESQSEAAIDGILVVSRGGVMTSFNRRFCQMWEIPDEVIHSRTDEQAIQSVLDKLADPVEFRARVRYLYEHPDEESRDEIRLKDGRVFDRFSAPVKGDDGELYGRVWYFRDVTGRKQTEENLRRAAEETRRMYEDLKDAQAQLIRSEKLASIGMLVSGVAHEINNPLNVMYGNLQLLAEVSDVLLPLSVEGARARKIRGVASRVSKFRGMIRDALKAARHAREIVHDFRNYARDARTAELVDLNQCLEEAVTFIQRELRPEIRVVRKLGRIPQVRCLRGQLSQVFLNLLKNAAESIEKKGTVTLRTQKAGGHVLVEVADTGRGMAEEVRRKLFEPFFTTKPVGKGLGLGLSISAMIVHNHNGRITVRSKPGKGSVFRVELPVLS